MTFYSFPYSIAGLLTIGDFKMIQINMAHSHEADMQTDLIHIKYNSFVSTFFPKCDANTVPVPVVIDRLPNSYCAFYVPMRASGSNVNIILLAHDMIRLRNDERSIYQDLIHELCHYVNDNDTRSTMAHDNEWCALMITNGVMPSDTGAPGGLKTGGDEMSDYVIPGGKLDKWYCGGRYD